MEDYLKTDNSDTYLVNKDNLRDKLTQYQDPLDDEIVREIEQMGYNRDPVKIKNKKKVQFKRGLTTIDQIENFFNKNELIPGHNRSD
jgi:hypothetical protein